MVGVQLLLWWSDGIAGYPGIPMNPPIVLNRWGMCLLLVTMMICVSWIRFVHGHSLMMSCSSDVSRAMCPLRPPSGGKLLVGLIQSYHGLLSWWSHPGQDYAPGSWVVIVHGPQSSRPETWGKWVGEPVSLKSLMLNHAKHWLLWRTFDFYCSFKWTVQTAIPPVSSPYRALPKLVMGRRQFYD